MPTNYWLTVFNLKTWDDFVIGGQAVAGFPESAKNIVLKIRLNDYLLCYLMGISRFIAVVQVMDASYQESGPPYGPVFAWRVPVRPVVSLAPERAVPIKEIRDLSIFKKASHPHGWRAFVRRSPYKWESSDGEIVLRILRDASSHPKTRPFIKSATNA
jgi:hypothetical protein